MESTKTKSTKMNRSSPRSGRGLQAMASAIVLGAAVAMAANWALAQQPIKMRVSIDNSPTHVQGKVIERFLDAVKTRSNGAIEPELFYSAQLYKDRDIAKALRQGSVDMGLPAEVLLGGIEPNIGLFTLPVFYGQPGSMVDKVADGEVGEAINRGLEQKLSVKVLGKWPGMGYVHTFSMNKQIKSVSDMAGMKIRVAGGGASQAARMKYFKAIPNTTPWPDVPMAIQQGVFDALVTTPNSAVSAKLWDAGVKYVYEDNQAFMHLIPMVSMTFWNKLGPAQQKMLVDVWSEQVDSYREIGALDQAKAKETLMANGVRFHTPVAGELAAARRGMLDSQEEVVKELKIDPALVSKAMAVLR